MYMCQWYRFCLFLRFLYWILVLFPQCGIVMYFCIFFYAIWFYLRKLVSNAISMSDYVHVAYNQQEQDAYGYHYWSGKVLILQDHLHSLQTLVNFMLCQLQFSMKFVVDDRLSFFHFTIGYCIVCTFSDYHLVFSSFIHHAVVL